MVRKIIFRWINDQVSCRPCRTEILDSWGYQPDGTRSALFSQPKYESSYLLIDMWWRNAFLKFRFSLNETPFTSGWGTGWSDWKTIVIRIRSECTWRNARFRQRPRDRRVNSARKIVQGHDRSLNRWKELVEKSSEKTLAGLKLRIVGQLRPVFIPSVEFDGINSLIIFKWKGNVGLLDRTLAIWRRWAEWNCDKHPIHPDYRNATRWKGNESKSSAVEQVLFRRPGWRRRISSSKEKIMQMSWLKMRGIEPGLGHLETLNFSNG